MSWALILAGSFFTVVGAIGLVRMPDVYTRMHAASVTDTLGAGLLLAGLMVQAGLGLVTLKLLFILILFFFMGPVATHALAQAALHAGVRPQLSEDRTERLEGREGRGEAAIEAFINMVLLTLLAAVTIGVVRTRNLFGVIVLAGIYSFLMASVLIVLDAVDVAMTEAAVGAGVSTVLLLATLHLTKSMEYPQPRKAYLPLFVAVGTGAAIVWGTYSLPPFGTPDNVIHKHVVPRYLADSVKETMVPNVVTSVLADYRGYDTLGETTVIFTAGIGVLLLLKGRRRRRDRRARGGGRDVKLDLILRIGVKFLLPFVLLFALYVQFHGELGPGGGFQAGVITAGMVILYAIIFGVDAAKRIAPQRMVEFMVPLGVLIYAGTGVAGLLLGKNFLDYSVLAHDPPHGRELGIFLVELGVLITVSGTMTALFYAFSERGR